MIAITAARSLLAGLALAVVAGCGAAPNPTIVPAAPLSDSERAAFEKDFLRIIGADTAQDAAARSKQPAATPADDH